MSEEDRLAVYQALQQVRNQLILKDRDYYRKLLTQSNQPLIDTCKQLQDMFMTAANIIEIFLVNHVPTEDIPFLPSPQR